MWRFGKRSRVSGENGSTVDGIVDTEIAENIIKKYLKNEGWDTLYKLEMKRGRTKYLIEGGVDKYDWEINFVIDPGYENKVKEIVASEKLDIPRPEEKLAYNVAKHEFSHWDTCPFDVEYYEEILEGVSKGLDRAGFNKKDIEHYSFEVANQFMDIIVNSIAACKDKEFVVGRGLKYLTVAHANKKKCTKGFALFADCQMKLYQNQDFFRKLAERFCKDYKEIKEESKKIISLLTTNHISKKAFSNTLDEQDKEFVVEQLEKRDEWGRKAKEFAQIVAKYVKEMEEEVGDSFSERFKKDEEFRREVIRKGLEKGHELKYAGEFDVFDEKYMAVAEEIVMEFLRDDRETPKFPLFYMRKKRLEEGDELRNVAWERTIFIDKNGEEDVWLYKKEVPYEVEEGGMVGKGSFEDILFIVDTSSSMGWRKPLDGSKYDLAIRSVYGAIKYLESVGKAYNINYGLIQFGWRGKTSWSGWKGYFDLDDLKRQLFSGYQNAGETILDGEKVEEAMHTSEDNFLAFMTSDGNIHNPKEALKACKEVINAGNDFVLLQIQSDNLFASSLSKSGAVVKHIKDPNDLVGLVLKKVKDKYGEGG